MKGNWIWETDNTCVNDWVVFEKTFSVKEIHREAVLCVSADTKYQLWLNGKRLVMDGSLYRESTPGCGYYDEVPLRQVQFGENRLVFLVWFHGNGGRCSVTTGRAGLWFSCEAYDFASDSETFCCREQAFRQSGEPHPSYLYGGDHICYEAEKACFNQETLEITGLHPATEYGEYGCAPWNSCARRPIPLIEFGSRISGVIQKTGEQEYRVQLPRCLQVTPWFQISAQGGEWLEIHSDRQQVHGGPGDSQNIYEGQRVEYCCKAGEQWFESANWFSAEQLIFTVPDTVKILQLGYRISRYPTQWQLPVVENPQLQILLRKCLNTLDVCMRDNFMDCPDRERGQWIGDVSVQAPQIFYVGDENAVKLLRKAICNFIQLRKGARLVGNVPGENFCELPAQSLNAISELGMIAEYDRHVDDRELLELCYLPIVQYLQLWQMDSAGLVLPRQGDWPWQDHLYNIDARVLENCWYYSAIKFALYLAEKLQKQVGRTFLEERKRSIEGAFEKTFWKGHCYSSLEGLSDERANALAILVGLANQEHTFELRNLLVSAMNCTPYFEYYVLSALCELGFREDAYYRMMTRYYGQIISENSTVWEDFRILGTKNHAWSGGPITIICKYFPALILKWEQIEM